MKPTILFVLKDSHYKTLGLDCYDEDRDAKTYTGTAPVVAHPPCQRWGALGKVNYARWGGDHNRPGNDGGCFKFALDTVNRCGGVLEHPAYTQAWGAYGLKRPPKVGWEKSGDGWVCEVWQSAYGHKANKKTWLYYSGSAIPTDPKWDRVVGTHQVGQECRQGIRKLEPWRNKPTLSKREANSTPVEFAKYLIELASKCNSTIC